MGQRKSLGCIAGIVWVLLGLVSGQAALSQTRIASAVNNNQRVVMRGTTPALIAKSTETGRMPAGQDLGRMILQLAPTAQQDQKAAKVVAALHDPSSPSYHKWLTPAQFGQLYGVSDYDAAQVQGWLQNRGLTVHEISQSHRFIVFSGTVAQVEDAFATQMHNYSYQDKSFVSNSTDIQIPAALQSVVKGVVRLHGDPRTPNAFMGGKVFFKKSPGQFSFDDGSHYMTPADFAKIYNLQPLYAAGIDGTGQTIAIVGRSNIDVQDIHAFRSLLGLPVNDPQVIVNGDDPGMTFYDLPEATLDVTWSGAVAPMATIKFVVSQSNFADGVDISAAYIVDHNVAPVMSTSYGACEQSLGAVGTAFYNSLWLQAAAEGITSFVSAGDNGGAGCDSPGAGLYGTGVAVNGIASTPYNVAVGGTQFDDTANPSAYWSDTNDPATGLSALGYIPEKVWNDSTADPNYPQLWAGSGGVSTLYAKPDWQTAPGVPNDGMRDLPDFSLSASGHDGYLVCLYRNCDFGPYFYFFGGTSASSPAAAGIMALVNQKLGGQPQGMANYVFYRLATVPGVYHDTVVGDNAVPDANGQYTLGYSAGPGYDLATGLGSFDANALVNNWQAASATLGSTTTLQLGSASPVVHGTPITFNAAVKCSGTGCTDPTGTVSLSATPSTGGNVVMAGQGLLNPGTPTSNSTIQTQKVPGGTYNVTARYSGDGTYYSSSSGPVQVTVTPEASQTYLGVLGGGSFNLTPSSIPYDEPLHLGFVVTGNSGFGYPSGTLTLQEDGQSVSTVLADTVTPSPVTLNYGENSPLLTSTSATASQASTISYLKPGSAIGLHQLVASYPGDNSFSSSTSNAYSFTITKAHSVIADFFPNGTPVANVPVMVGGQVALSNFCAPYGGTITVSDMTSGTPVVVGSGTLNPLYCDSYNFPVTFPASGTRIVRVDYSGDSNVNPSFAVYPVFPVAANVPASVSLSADLPTATAGTAVTLTAVVTSDAQLHTPTGTVTFLDGTAVLGTAALDATGTAVFVTKTLAGGQHNITASYPGDAITTASVSSPITEVILDYIFQALPGSLTIQGGQSGTAALNVIPLGGYSQAVQFSCGPLPAGVGCVFSQSSVTPDGVHPSTATLTIKTSVVMASRTGNSAFWAVSATGLLSGMLLLPFGKRRHVKGSLLLSGTLLLLLSGIGCGGSASQGSKNPTTFTLNVTSTSSTGSKAVALVVNIIK